MRAVAADHGSRTRPPPVPELLDRLTELYNRDRDLIQALEAPRSWSCQVSFALWYGGLRIWLSALHGQVSLLQ
jgi:hypothetical protein